MPKPVLVVGSINLDLVVSAPKIPFPGETLIGQSFQTFLGGKGANQAVAVARLGSPVEIIGKVGDDDIGKRLIQGLKSAGVRTGAVGIEKRSSSGVALIATDASGQNSIIVIAGANSRVAPRDLRQYASLVASAGIILTQLETPLETVAALVHMAARNDIPVMLDPAPAQNLPAEILQRITWLTPNETETAFLCGDSASELSEGTAKEYAEQLQAHGPKYVIVKLGRRGAFLVSHDGIREWFPAFKVKAVDSTAAGDAFNGGLAVALMKGMKVKEALRFGSAVAAISVTRNGAQPSMPTMRETTSFLRRATATS
jgi:ribokinase